MKKNIIINLLLMLIAFIGLYDAAVLIDLLHKTDIPYRKFMLVGVSFGVVISILMGIYVWRQRENKRR